MTSATGPAVLISGAGIAGPTLAYWLQHYGFSPLIEAAPAPRSGGYMIDFWGAGFDARSFQAATVASSSACCAVTWRAGYTS